MRHLYILACVFMVVLLISVAYGENLQTISEFRYDSNGSVKGCGFVSSCQNLLVESMSLSSMKHGTGQYDSEDMAQVRQEIYQYNPDFYLGSNNHEIDLKERSDMVYSAQALDLGGSMRLGPMESLWSDRTYTDDNLFNGTFMDSSFSRAASLKSDLTVSLGWLGWGNYVSTDYTNKSLNVSFNGAGHLGIQKFDLPAHKLQELVEQDYLGTFNLSQKTLQTGKKEIEQKQGEDSSWMSCLCGKDNATDVDYVPNIDDITDIFGFY